MLEEPTEASPLIPAPEPEHQEQSLRSGWPSDAIRTAGLAAAFLIFFAFADVLKYISTVRLLELGICREYYMKNDPSVIDSHGNIPESLCRNPEGIQQRLAHLRGYLSALEAIVGLLLTLPFGLVVNRVGERAIAAINVLGYLLSCAWLVLVCFYYSTFPIWTAVLAPLFRIIGGGSPVLSSVIYSVAAKHVPDANRSLCFFFFVAAQLLTEIVSIMVAAVFLEHDFLYTPMLLNLPFGILCLVTLLLIKTDEFSNVSPGHETEQVEGDKGVSSIGSSIRILFQLLRNQNVLVLLATVPVAKLVNPITELMLQYIPKKFDVSLAWATRALSIQAIESLALLVVILPIVKEVAQIRYHVMPTKVDLSVAQFGFIAMSIGCLIMAFSQKLVIFILGLFVFTFGCSTRPALQSVLTGLVSREHIAVLYTIIAIGDGIGSAAGSLMLNRTLAAGIGWDGKLYLGLPFVVGAVCYFACFSGSLFAGHSALQVKPDDEMGSIDSQ